MSDFYDRNGQEFFERTAYIDMGEKWAEFLRHLPSEARILDAGCGSGRDARHFAGLGHRGTAIDASAEMVRLATRFTGLPVAQARLQDLDYASEFDGVWCCAAALHVPPAELVDVLHRLHGALRVGGVCYLSFKFGDGLRQDGERTFLDMDLNQLVSQTKKVVGVDIVRSWTTRDSRRANEQLWVNQISRRS